MEEEQKKFMKLKEAEFKMKEEELMNKYSLEMETVKEQYTKKNQELQQHILA